MQCKSVVFTLLCAFIAAASSTAAHAVINSAPADAAIVTLRTQCTEGGAEVRNCFNSMSTLDAWLRDVRKSGPTRPTLVDIGPGTFGPWICTVSNVTLRGSGRDQTVISGQTTTSNHAIVINQGCTRLNVQDLKIVGGSLWGVVVNDIDTVTAWTNVDLEGPAYAWTETNSTGGPVTACSSSARHFWFSSRIRATGASGGSARAYQAICAQSWFWGSEVSALVPASLPAGAFALETYNAEVHFYGSNVSVKIAGGANASNVQLINARQGSEIHIHGTGLDVIHGGTGEVTALMAEADSHFHANESAYNIHITGSGSVTRLAGAGEIDSPYQWGPRREPPPVKSRTGADMYVETDCQQSGPCGSSGNFPRLMIYRAECATQGPWFDTVTQACRQ